MKTRKIKLFNGGDWDHKGGHLYVGAWSIKDAVDLINQACRKIKNYDGSFTAHEIQVYWSKGCWGTSMTGVVPERGVWWAREIGGGHAGKPERII